MVTRLQTDVVVVGGGPAGSAAATHLARAGVDVLLVDKAHFPREKACAEYLSPGVVDALDELGALGRVQSAEHRQLDAMRVVARGREIPLPFTVDRPTQNRAIAIKRSVLDDELLRFAAEAGATVMQGSRVSSLIADDNDHGVLSGVQVRNGDEEFQVDARFVVAADGLHSTVSRLLQLDRPVRWPRKLGLVARFGNVPRPIEDGQMHIGEDIYCGLSPIGDAEVNVSLVVPMGYKPSGTPTGEFYDHMIRTLPGIDRLLGNAERTTNVRGVGPLGKRVRKPYGRGYLLVGDAAGFFDPLTGEGIHRALVGGKLAAQYVQKALTRPDRRPVGYRRARTRAFGDKQRVCNIIQLLLESPALFNYVTSRAANRDEVRSTLRGILGDYVPARQALQPAFLWNMLRP